MPEQLLYLARHAHALDDAPSDDERPLSPKGRKQLARLCGALRGKDLITPDAIWHSGLLRARETAEALKEGLALDAPLFREPGLAPCDDPVAAAARLSGLDLSCLVAGHEPILSAIAALLLGGGPAGPSVVFEKASILCLSRAAFNGRALPWTIRWHVNHRLFG